MSVHYIEGAVDCHAHAFPGWQQTLKEVGGALPSTWREPLGRVGDGARGLLAQLPWREPKELDLGHYEASGSSVIERTSALRGRLPRPLRDGLEMAVSVVAGAPPILLGTPARLLASMDRVGLERSVLIAAHTTAPNSWILKQASNSAGRLIPCTILPDLLEGAPLAEWISALHDLAERGARGFKIHPNFDDKSADHPAYRAVFEVASARRLFVILHTGCFAVPVYPNRRPAEPSDFEPLFAAHPEVPVCLAHMNRDHPERAWQAMARHGQLYADTSWQPADSIARAIEAVGAHRLLLGSDWPLLHRGLQADALALLLRGAGDHATQIAADNPRRFLGEDARGL